MKTISTNQIKTILDDALKAHKAGIFQTKNIIFQGEDGIGRGTVINKWLNDHKEEVNPCKCLEPAPAIFPEGSEEYDRVRRSGEKVYGFDDATLERLSEKNRVLVCKRLGFSKTPEVMAPYYSIFAHRTATSPFCNKKYDLSNLFLIIATALPKGPGYSNNIADISSYEAVSEVYHVEPDIHEFLDYLQKKHDLLVRIRSKRNGLCDLEPEREYPHDYFIKSLSSERFHFHMSDGGFLSPATLEMIYSDFCYGESIDESKKRINKIIQWNIENKEARSMLRELLNLDSPER